MIAALAAGAVAMKRGERSWLNVVALLLALIIGMPWLSFVLGKVFGSKRRAARCIKAPYSRWAGGWRRMPIYTFRVIWYGMQMYGKQ